MVLLLFQLPYLNVTTNTYATLIFPCTYTIQIKSRAYHIHMHLTFLWDHVGQLKSRTKVLNDQSLSIFLDIAYPFICKTLFLVHLTRFLVYMNIQLLQAKVLTYQLFAVQASKDRCNREDC